MNILEGVSLRNHSTMRLGGTADFFTECASVDKLEKALLWAREHSLPFMVIGDGSNIVWRDSGFHGLVIKNTMQGFRIDDQGNYAIVTIAAGENWDHAVARTTEAGLTGIEALSLIPGTAGATPVQNVGAYGQEIADTLIDLEAYDTQKQMRVTIPAADCDFSYRMSRFKGLDRGRFIILSIRLRLQKANPTPPFYQALQTYFEQHNITVYTPQVVREAVIAIRRSKLPDPAVVANNGSFFANPVLLPEQFNGLQAQYPDIPHWPMPGGHVKIPAAWLLEQAGFKDYHDATTGMGTWPAQPLVLVNEQAQSTDQLLAFRQKIIDTVYQTFGITLEQEPELLPLE